MWSSSSERAVLLVIAAWVALAGSAAAQAPAAQADQARVEYLIGAQDVLTITVWDSPDLSGKFTVETDGSFTFPLIGRVKAGGLTLRQFEAELKKKLADGYFKNPQVSVAVETYRSQRIFIVGEVRNPGTYQLTGDMTLIEAIARAGSTTPAAAPEAIVVRAPAGKQTDGPILPGQREDAPDSQRVNLRNLQSGVLSQNIALRDGDTIFVPRAESIYVFGQVKNPGAYALQSTETTVLQALSLAGGVTDRGAANRIKIVRVVKGEKVEIKVKLTDPVLPGDTLIVPEKFF
jgi:polysaccharide export outer membrane protein